MSYYPSKSGSPLGHDTDGITCSCGYKCWAIDQEKAKNYINKILGRIEPEIKLPDKQKLIEDQIAYARRPTYSPTLDDLRESDIVTKELHRVSVAKFKERMLVIYYQRFV